MLHKPSFAFTQAFGADLLMVEMSAMDDNYDRPMPCDVVDGVAVIEISGMLTSGASWWGTTYSEIRDSVTRCVESADVQGILLSIDSPGGSTDGAFELAADLVKAGKQKPIWCVADVNCYSAAYLLASTAAKLYQATTSGGVGSIGVYVAHLDYSKKLEKEGINITLISAGKGKTNANQYEPLSKDAKGALKENVDRLYAAFVEAVAKNRNMTADAVINLGAQLFQGAAAGMAAGLSDAKGTFETALADFQAYLSKKKPTPMIFNAAAATSGANSQQEVQMDTQTTGVETSAAAVNAPPPASVAVAPPNPATMINDGEMVQLCAIAGCPELAAGFVGTPIAEVRKALLDRRVEAQEKTEISGHQSAGAKPPAQSPLLAAMERMGKGGF